MSRRWKILNAEPVGFDANALEILAQAAEVTGLCGARSELARAVAEADGLIVKLAHRIDAELLAAAKNLKFVATITTGHDHIDAAELLRRGIALLSLRGDGAFLDKVSATAELTWGLLLALVRRIPQASASVLAGQWRRDGFKGRELAGQTLGIVGLGRLGRMVARYARAFGMTVLANEPNVDESVFAEAGVVRSELHDLLSCSDIVSLHLHMDESTRHFLQAERFAAMKPGALLINTARGGLVDEAALLNALASGQLGGAALDVLDEENSGRVSGNEDWLKSNPLFVYARSHENLILTPHIGGLTRESLVKAERHLVAKVVAFVQGCPDPDKADA